MMAIDTSTQIENINRSLHWIQQNHPEHYEQRFLQLVDERRKLRKIKEAEDNNPAIAAYGKSQVGKSHIMGCLLQQEIIDDKGNKGIKQFEVKANGKSYNFVEEINPPGEGKEATGVVTRFSSFTKNSEEYNPEYPALMRSLSAKDITLIMCDGYYNNIKDYTTDGRTEINERVSSLFERYSRREQISNTPIVADDILEMGFYFRNYLNKAQEFNRSEFFNRLAMIVDRIPVDDYVEVFSYLWNDNPYITSLYKRLLGVLSKLDFKKNVYLPIEAVLHNNVKKNTVMSVFCLNALAEPDEQLRCNVWLKNNDGSFKCLPDMDKSELSAICAEVVFKIEPDFLESSLKYDIESIQDPLIQSQVSKEPIKMDILKDVDLLDFPGARSYKSELTASLNEVKVIDILLRGKVAYLFNKYSDDKIINILLYCHDNEQNDVTSIYLTLNEWVKQYIGNTPEKRQRTLELNGGISPLFYVATKFNIDMAEQTADSANSITAIENRWIGRFEVVLYKECFNVEAVDWAKNWTREGESFQNSYLLRDFKYSGPKGSRLYAGFKETGKETSMLVSEEYMSRMRKSFCESKATGMFFKNRALSWDVATTMNNDGSLYIIENLAKASSQINNTRSAQFNEQLHECVKKVLKIMQEYFISDDTAEILAENIRKANGIFRELEFTCQSTPEYFGHLLQGLQMSETRCYKEIHRLIPLLPSIVGDNDTIKDYELIRNRCDHFRGCTTESQKWQRLIDTYRFTNQEEAADYLTRRGVESHMLFKGGKVNRKNSAIIAKELVDIWQKYISSTEFSSLYSGKDRLDGIVLNNLIDCLMSSAENINLREKIEKEICDYVDILKITEINQDLIADMISTTISDFVMDFGYHFLNQEQKDNSFRVAKEQRLNIYHASQESRKESYDEEGMTELFNTILSSSSRFTPAYEANYNSWIEYMYISYIVHLNVPEYDRSANDELKQILDAMRSAV